MRNKLFLVLLITIVVIQLSVTGLAKLETIKVGNHTISVNIPNFPQYYISSTVLGNEEAIEIKFNESLLKSLLIESNRIQISIYNAGEGQIYPANISDLENDLTNWGENNYPGEYNIYMKKIAGNPGVVLEHPYSSIYKNMVLEATSFIDFNPANEANSKLYIYSTYDRIITGAVMDSMIIKKIK